ncbi:MAG: SRPBCC family protein [Candidatus Omnitrophica bacterium]|nr:SRPBCC family protein [Candidatus Omnitrophota bacterium]
MPEKELAQIKVSRLIPAKKWRVIRVVTRVQDFPGYIPTVKEASVIWKSGNRMQTKWFIQVDKVPIRWVEEDVLDLSQSAIFFKAIEGDISEFWGEWKFTDRPEGTLVSVTVYLRLDIPAIKEFAEAYIKKMLTRNFEAMLESIEKHIISNRYKNFKKGNEGKVAGFGVIGHFYNFCHLERSFKMLSPGAKLPSREFLGQLFNISPAFKMYDIPEFRSKTGEVTRGCFIVATFIPDMVEKDMWAIFSKVVRACRIAEKYGVGVVALGGFTSIVGERIGQEIANEVDVAVTTGNTFTAAMALDGTFKAAGLLGTNIMNAKAAVIGGTGDIGSACSRVLTDKVRQITITGRTKATLRDMRSELLRHRKAAVVATTDNHAAVKDADIVITAASSTQSILDAAWFKPGAVICDVGYPKNISYAPVTRNDILIFSGGLARTPTPVNFPVDTGLPATNVMYGCFAEAAILALEHRFESFSFGRGKITPEKIEEIRQMGAKHGFEVADFYWGDKLVDAPLFEKIKELTNA